MSNKIKVIIKSYDARILDSTAKLVCDALSKFSIKFSGPIPLPVERKRFVVLKSPHVNKDARQTFEQRSLKRLIQIEESKTAVAALSGMKNISPSVNIEIKRVKGMQE